MSVLCVGLSHRTAPVELLEHVSAAVTDVDKLLEELVTSPPVTEALLLATCNRVEIYVDVEKFHGGVQVVSAVLARGSGVPLEDLSNHLYVHYEDRAVAHLFAVASGLDSMVVGESQILGQLRSAFHAARSAQTVGRALDVLASQALRVGKRVHTQTGIDRAGASLVSVGLGLADEALGGLSGRTAVVVGAGAMSSLAATTLRRLGVGDIVVVNRTPAKGARLAQSVGGRSAAFPQLPAAVADVDLLVSCTGATGVVVTVEDVGPRPDRPLFVLDLALPRDVDSAVRALTGVTVVDLDALRSVLDERELSADVDAARHIVAEEVAAFLAARRSARVAPTVAALRSKAAEVVDAELLRLAARLPELDERARREVAGTVRRVVDKLLHAPTVRVKELAEGPDGDAYAAALRELFDLDPAAPAAVTQAEAEVPATPGADR